MAVKRYIDTITTEKRGKCSQIKMYSYKKKDNLFDELTSLLDDYELSPQLEEWAMQTF